ncbi:IclR family transcriptional regulator [Halomarina oriensis]|uniref:Helix-turn-helix domain-containing protein n=1 Tax=Halomarina oriensis TaxID=671145 RepID=A0A6B0GM19_9EURY|nr:IclR family transcriptional regulator [Halomarina oriensis]MWG34529.1 helix-turn-helix domain-containing protein [Halomarina oriensis]
MPDYPVGAVRTNLRIVAALSSRTDAGVTELATELDLSKGSVHNHLTTLERLGVVVAEDGRYRLGLRLLDVGMQVRDGMELYQTARSPLAELASSTNESTALVVAEHGDAVYADVCDAARNDRRVRLGTRLPLHTTAAGKAVLAQYSLDEVEAYVETDGLQRRTNRTITDAASLRDELRTITDRRLAYDRGEAFTGMRAVAAPVRLPDHPPAAISVLGPGERFSGKRLEEDLPGLVISAANQIELTLTD